MSNETINNYGFPIPLDKVKTYKTSDAQTLILATDGYPQLFPTLQQQYAEHQPDQTLTEQEHHVIGLIVIKCSPLQMSALLITSKPNVSNIRRRLFNKLTGKDGSSSDLDMYVMRRCASRRYVSGKVFTAYKHIVYCL